MPKTRSEKELEVARLTENIAQAKGTVFASFTKLSVKAVEELRDKCREASVLCGVVKKTLLSRALKEKKLESEGFDGWQGNILAGFGVHDEVTAAKIFAAFAKDHEQMHLEAGILEAAIVGKEEIARLASLPGKQDLLAKLVGSCQAPISGFVGVLSGNLRNLVGVLNAVKEAKS